MNPFSSQTLFKFLTFFTYILCISCSNNKKSELFIVDKPDKKIMHFLQKKGMQIDNGNIILIPSNDCIACKKFASEFEENNN